MFQEKRQRNKKHRVRSKDNSVLKPLQVPANKQKRARKPAAAKKKLPSDAVVHRKKTFTCDLCQRHIGTKGGLKYHISAHLLGRPFKCDVCTKSYATKNDLTTHKKIHAARITCDFCQKTFTTKHNAADHMATMHLPKVFPCGWCKRLCATKSMLNRHLHVYHEKLAFPKPLTKYTCDICKAVFTNKLSFKHHVKMSALVKYKCFYCQEKFACRGLFYQHRKQEEKSFNHKCPICHEHIVNSVYAHIRYQHQKHQCDICPFFCETSCDFSQHKKMCGTDEQIKAICHKCTLCELTFRTRTLMYKHRIDAHDGPFKCILCPSQYWVKCSYKAHLKRHEVCKIRCLVCRKLLFSSMERFNIHFRRHHAHGPVDSICCSACQMTFRYKRHLRKHIICQHLP
jgi:KRAB domain-containing zinc finger protein